MSSTAILIVLEFDRATDFPRGTATAAGEGPREFRGWIELAAAIAALAGGGDAAAHDTTRIPIREGATP